VDAIPESLDDMDRLATAPTNLTVTAGQAWPADISAALSDATAFGRVLDDAGNPVVGVVLVSANFSTGDYALTETDEDGLFELPLSAGGWSMQFLPETLEQAGLVAPITSTFSLITGQHSDRGNLTLQRAVGRVRVRFVNEDGLPQPGVGVRFAHTLSGTNYLSLSYASPIPERLLPVLAGNWELRINSNDCRTAGFFHPPTRVLALTTATNQVLDIVLQSTNNTPRLDRASAVAGNQLSLRLVADPSASYVVESSLNLTNWADSQTLTTSTGPTNVTLTLPGGASRQFYRVRKAGPVAQ
jgi:hypothetical protein